MIHARRLIESRPYLSRIPDDSLIVTDAHAATSVPGAGRYRFVATRDSLGSYAFIYAPIGRKFSVDLRQLSGDRIVAWWFNPRTGQATHAGEFDKKAPPAFFANDMGEDLDAVLVLDDASKNYPPPGSQKFP